MAEEAKNDYRDNIDDVTVLRMGEILIAQEDIIQQTATGEKELIKAGSKGVIGVDKLLHHYNGRISRFGDDVEIKGYWFIENPRGGLRKMTFMKDLPRYTVTYCQYGDTRMKPTDIWTNHPNPQFKPMCHNGDSCHQPAPRGSKTGTQGLKGAVERSVIPEKLCLHIADICK